MFCHKCGNQMADDAAFCHKCGVKLVIDNAAVPIEAGGVQMSYKATSAPKQEPQGYQEAKQAGLHFLTGKHS